MTGATIFFDNDNNSLQIKFEGSRAANTLICAYDKDADLYNLIFVKLCGIEIKEVSKHEGVYFDTVLPIFEQVTGLSTRL